jgi:hypothetical protein
MFFTYFYYFYLLILLILKNTKKLMRLPCFVCLCNRVCLSICLCVSPNVVTRLMSLPCCLCVYAPPNSVYYGMVLLSMFPQSFFFYAIRSYNGKYAINSSHNFLWQGTWFTARVISLDCWKVSGSLALSGTGRRSLTDWQLIHPTSLRNKHRFARHCTYNNHWCWRVWN